MWMVPAVGQVKGSGSRADPPSPSTPPGPAQPASRMVDVGRPTGPPRRDSWPYRGRPRPARLWTQLEVFAMNMLPAGRVVIGLDGSLAAYSALRYAVAEARRRGAVLIVVRAYAPAAVRGMPDATLTREAVDEVGQAFAEAMGAMPRDLDVRLLTRVGE